jgi:hypothetical protein
LQACLNCLMSRFRVIGVASLASPIYLDLGSSCIAAKPSLFVAGVVIYPPGARTGVWLLSPGPSGPRSPCSPNLHQDPTCIESKARHRNARPKPYCPDVVAEDDMC